jgi:hypothetical protein
MATGIMGLEIEDPAFLFNDCPNADWLAPVHSLCQRDCITSRLATGMTIAGLSGKLSDTFTVGIAALLKQSTQ